MWILKNDSEQYWVFSSRYLMYEFIERNSIDRYMVTYAEYIDDLKGDKEDEA